MSISAMTVIRRWRLHALTAAADWLAPLLALLAVVLLFSSLSPHFLSITTFTAVAFQLPELGLLTLAMLLPVITGGLNLAITFTANIAGLSLAWVMHRYGALNAGVDIFLLGLLLAVIVGAVSGLIMGQLINLTGAHPILVSLSMMIFLRGLGEFLTRGGDISGFPGFVTVIGHGRFLGIPIPFLILLVAVLLFHILLAHHPLGFATRMIGSNIKAADYSGINTRKTMVLVYVLSGVMAALAGVIMLARFNSVRVGHGESYLLITVLACFLGGINPFGGFGRVLPVFLALLVLQLLASGLNLIGANPHLATAVWGIALLAIMVLRVLAGRVFIFFLSSFNKES